MERRRKRCESIQSETTCRGGGVVQRHNAARISVAQGAQHFDKPIRKEQDIVAIVDCVIQNHIPKPSSDRREPSRAQREPLDGVPLARHAASVGHGVEGVAMFLW